MQRVAVLVEVNLDPIPGACSTPESWKDVIQDLLNGVVPHYEPTVTNVTPCRTTPRHSLPGRNRATARLGPASLTDTRPRPIKIRWGNIAAYVSMLLLTGLLLWMLIDYTNVPR